MSSFRKICPQCNEVIERNTEITFCPYCGAKISFDNSYEINYTQRKIDYARMHESDSKERIKMKELEIKENEKIREERSKNRYLVGCVITMVAFIAFCFFMSIFEKPSSNEIAIPASADYYVGENYEKVTRQLKNMGFYSRNISYIEQEDLVKGWLIKEGAIESISINGNEKFAEGEIFSKDSQILITYHTFKNK